MKINKIHVSNVLRISDVSIESTAPIILVSGANEAGKSSLMDAVSFALQGRLPRVGLKKNLNEAVHSGKENGLVEVSTDSGEFFATLPDGKGVHCVHPMLNMVMDAGRFAAMTDNDRRTLLFELSGLQCDSKHIGERLIARGCDAKKVAEIATLLRSGFPAAETEARAKVRETKAGWKAITGGETWGKDKAAKWKPEELPAESDKAEGRAEDARQKAIEVERELANAQQGLGAARAELKRRQQGESQRAALEKCAGKANRIKSKLALDNAELKQWEAKVAVLKAHIAEKQAIKNEPPKMTCPSCESVLMAHEGALAHWHHEGVTQTTGSENGDEAKLPEYEKALSLLQRAVANSTRDLADAESAAAKLAEIDGEKADEIDLVAIQDKVSALFEMRNAWRADSDKYQAIVGQIARNRLVTDRADALHSDILDWSKIADALAPNGILGEMLADAIKPLNERLRATSVATGWDQVSIDDDMTLRINWRQYSLCSQSARYRANVAMVEAISYLSGLRFFAIDEFDCLDSDNRMVGLKWLHQLATSGEIDTALVFGTFKQPPKAPGTFQVLWLERGEITGKEPLRSAA